jgi:hypothetical protein
MSNPVDNATTLAGTDNPIPTTSNLGDKRPTTPAADEQAAASADGDARTTLNGNGTSNPQSNTSGGSSPVNAAEKCKKERNELLSQAVGDAELLAIYLSRNGMSVNRDGKDVTPEVVQGITDAREQFESGELIGPAEAMFLKHYRELAAAASPVTVASLRDSTSKEEGVLPWWLFFGRKVKSTRARVASYKYWAFAAIALLLLILAQSYYVVGTNLIQLLPEYGQLVEQEQAVLKGVAPKKDATEQSQTLSDSLLQADRKMLCGWLAWCPLMDTPMKASTSLNAAAKPANALVLTDTPHPDTDAVIVKSRQVLGVFQGYLLPLLYGWTGAAAYIVRSLAREARERLYRRENDIAYTLRLFLGALAGLAIGWFLKPEDVSGFKAVSPFALAFVAGYSVDLLFTFLDKVVNAFSAPQEVPPPKAP